MCENKIIGENRVRATALEQCVAPDARFKLDTKCPRYIPSRWMHGLLSSTRADRENSVKEKQNMGYEKLTAT